MRRLQWTITLTAGLVLAASAGAQTMTEFGAAAAGGTVGGASGKKVSDGITNIFGKVDQQTKAAAKADPAAVESPVPAPATTKPAPAKKAPTARTAGAKKPAKPAKAPEPPNVPDPPDAAPHHTAVARTPSAPVAPQAAIAPAPVVPPPPPPPQMTADQLRSIAPGVAREEVLKFGVPASRITMLGDQGHLLEIYSYVSNGAMLGVVRLNDGAVSQVELR